MDSAGAGSYDAVPLHQHGGQLTFGGAGPFQLAQIGVGLFDVEGFGVESAAEPFQHGLVVFVFGILDDVKEVRISADPCTPEKPYLMSDGSS